MNLQDFAIGDKDYISKLNGNNQELTTNITNINNQLYGSTNAAAAYSGLLSALFGNNKPVRIGLASYGISTSGSTITVSPGSSWKPSSQTLVTDSSSTTLNFSGYAAATYYIACDSTGIPQIVTSSSDAMYSVVWQGAGFGTITPLANIFLSADDEAGALYSSKYNTTYSTLNARLDHIESLLP